MKSVSVHFFSALLFLLTSASLTAKTIVFWQPGFPIIDSQAAERATLDKSLSGMNPVFTDLPALQNPGALTDTDLLILPYGSAVPVDAWKVVESYLHAGGNLLILGGRPLRVPVTQSNGKFEPGRPRDTYARTIGFQHTLEVPVGNEAQFRWKDGYPWSPVARIKARRFFAIEGHLDGLGYMVDATGLRVAAPLIFADRHSGGRVVCLDFDPEPGYWESQDGVALVHQAASFARQGAIEFSVEALFSTVRPGEPPVLTAHIHEPKDRPGNTASGQLQLTLSDEKGPVDSATVPVT